MTEKEIKALAKGYGFTTYDIKQLAEENQITSADHMAELLDEINEEAERRYEEEESEL